MTGLGPMFTVARGKDAALWFCRWLHKHNNSLHGWFLQSSCMHSGVVAVGTRAATTSWRCLLTRVFVTWTVGCWQSQQPKQTNRNANDVCVSGDGDNPCVCLVPNCLPVLVWSCFSSGNCWLQQQTDPQHGSLKRMWDFFFLGKFQVEGKASVPYSAETGGAGSKIGLCSVSIPLSLRPPPRVDNHNSRLSF